MQMFRKLWSDKRGAGAIEYALVASLISVAAIAAYQNLGTKVQTSFQNIDQHI
jgi:pilus assembly protein Flp/PilA